MSQNTDAASVERSKLYKNAGKTEDLRRRRAETSVELRRQKRNDEMMKRRNLNIDVEESDSNISDVDDGTKSPPALSIPETVAILSNNPTIDQIRMAFESVRRILSRSSDPPVDEVISSGLLTALVKALEIEDEKVQFEGAWALTNIVSGTSEQTIAAVNAGIVKPLLTLCASPSQKLSEQCVWAIANIAGESVEMRDMLVEAGLVPILVHIMQKLSSLNVQFIRTITWTFSNLCRHKNPQISYEVLKEIAPAITTLLNYNDTPVKQDACWAISYLTDGPDANIELAMDAVPTVLELSASGVDSLVAPSLRVLGNFATGNDALTQVVVDCGVLRKVIPTLLEKGSSTVSKECCWLISNVLAGTQEQIQEVIDAGLVPIVLNLLRNGDHRSQYEAGWAVANLAHGGTTNQILELCRAKGGLEAIVHCLTVKNNELVTNTLEALHVILSTVATSTPENLERVSLIIEECGGLDHLEVLQQSESEVIYDLSYKIVDEFFNNEDEVEEKEAISAVNEELDLTANTNFNF